MGKSRIEPFSDGVFAIAITLLVLEIKVPEPNGHLAHELLSQWPSYAGYAVSFLTIGIIWVNHHAQFDRVARVDRTLLFLNLFLLMAVAFIPFPTALMAAYLKAGSGEDVAAAVYSASFLLMGLTFAATWLYAATRGLLHDHFTPRQVRKLTVRNVSGQFGYVLAVALAFLSPYASLAVCAAVAVYYVVPGRAVTETSG
jgi:uncharacterized membrane protein